VVEGGKLDAVNYGPPDTLYSLNPATAAPTLIADVSPDPGPSYGLAPTTGVVVPEPATWALLLTGMAVLGFARLRVSRAAPV
jgi:PEP-CTERM motif